MRRVIARSNTVSKPRDLHLELSKRYEIRQHSCWGACWISVRYFKLSVSRLDRTLTGITTLVPHHLQIKSVQLIWGFHLWVYSVKLIHEKQQCTIVRTELQMDCETISVTNVRRLQLNSMENLLYCDSIPGHQLATFLKLVVTNVYSVHESELRYPSIWITMSKSASHYLKKTAHNTPSHQSYDVSIVRYCEETDCVITALHCTLLLCRLRYIPIIIRTDHALLCFVVVTIDFLCIGETVLL